MATSIQIWVSATAPAGQAFTAPTAAVSAQPYPGVLAFPTVNSVVATQTQASGYKEFWVLVSNLGKYDNVWNGSAWIQASTVAIAPVPNPTPVPTPAPAPTPTPTPAPVTPTSVVTLAAGQSVQVNFAGSASITIAAAS
jgi:hypothetical protein